MINLGNRLIDDDGNVVYFTEALMEMLYRGEQPCEILFPKDDIDIKAYNKNAYENGDPQYVLPERIKTHKERQNKWFYPKEYDDIDLHQYFHNLCKNDVEVNRVNEELVEYERKGFNKFLRFCIYFSDKMKENNWVIGVGRGSACCSYLLRILKIHLVDSIKYNLNIKEFLKD